MKKIILTLLIALIWMTSFAQQKAEAEKLVDEGAALHDKENYDGALAKYEQALKLDKDNLYALVEMAYTYLAQKKYNDAIRIAEQAVKIHKTGNELKTLYVTYGNSLDMVDRAAESIAVYNMGLKQFPEEQMLYFNKGITLIGLKRYEEALLALQKSAMLKPNHPGTQNAIGNASKDNYPIGAMLAYWRFFTIEPTGTRAKTVNEKVLALMNANVKQNGDKNVNISIPSPGDNNAKPKENSFSSAYLMLSMAAALDYGAEYKNETEVNRFIRKFDVICAALKETKQNNYGFFWDYYAPYFIELKSKGFSEVFAHVVFASQGKPEIIKYFTDNKSQLEAFSKWSDSFQWKKY